MKYVFVFVFAFIIVAVILSGCASTKYVCYDNTVQKDSKDCPVYPRIVVTEQSAGIAADNFGRAVAGAKQHTYTRVNIYTEKDAWFATVLFTNPQTQEIYRVGLKISGQTSDVTCVTNCEYLGFE